MNSPGGTDKTFLYNTLLINVRLREGIAVTVASFRIATLLISNERTAYS